jgi:hypothetical protein
VLDILNFDADVWSLLLPVCVKPFAIVEGQQNCDTIKKEFVMNTIETSQFVIDSISDVTWIGAMFIWHADWWLNTISLTIERSFYLYHDSGFFFSLIRHSLVYWLLMTRSWPKKMSQFSGYAANILKWRTKWKLN